MKLGIGIVSNIGYPKIASIAIKSDILESN